MAALIAGSKPLHGKDTDMAKTEDPETTIPSGAFNLWTLMEVRDAWNFALFRRYNVVATAIGLYHFRENDSAAFRVRHEKAPPRTLRNSVVRSGESWPCIMVFVRNWVPLQGFSDRAAKRSQRDARRDSRQVIPPFLEYKDLIAPTCVISVSPDDDALGPIDNPTFFGPDNAYGGGSAICTRVQQVDHFATVSCLVTDDERIYALSAGHVVGKEGQPVYPATRSDDPATRSGDPSIGRTTGRRVGHVPLAKLFPEFPFDSTLSTLDAGLIEIEDANQWTSTLYEMGTIGSVFDEKISLDLLGTPVKGYGARSHAVKGQVAGLYPVYKSLAGQFYSAHLLIGPRNSMPEAFRNTSGDSGTLYVVDEDSEGTESQPLQPLAINWGVLDFETPGQDLHLSLATMCNIICRQLDVSIVPSHNVSFGPVWGAANHRTFAGFAQSELAKLPGPLSDFLRVDRAADATIDQLAVTPDCWNYGPMAVQVFHEEGKGFVRNKKEEGPNHYADIDPGTKEITNGRLHDRIGDVFAEMIDYVKRGKLNWFYSAAWVLAHYCADACNPAHVSICPNGHDNWKTDRDGNKVKVAFHSQWDNAKLKFAMDKGKLFEKLPAIDSKATAAKKALELLKHTLETIDVCEYVFKPDGSIQDYGEAKTKVRDFIRSQKGQNALKECIVPALKLWYSLVLSAWKKGGGDKISDKKLNAVTFKDPVNSILGNKNFLPSQPS
jgi:hypothetical protein